MRTYNVRLTGGQAKITILTLAGTSPEGEPQWSKRTLIATSPKELWEGLQALDGLWDSPRRYEHLKALTKEQEHTQLSSLTDAWESMGNQITRLPMAGKKARLTSAEEEEILELLANIDDEEDEDFIEGLVA